MVLLCLVAVSMSESDIEFDNNLVDNSLVDDSFKDEMFEDVMYGGMEQDDDNDDDISNDPFVKGDGVKRQCKRGKTCQCGCADTPQNRQLRKDLCRTLVRNDVNNFRANNCPNYPRAVCRLDWKHGCKQVKAFARGCRRVACTGTKPTRKTNKGPKPTRRTKNGTKQPKEINRPSNRPANGPTNGPINWTVNSNLMRWGRK